MLRDTIYEKFVEARKTYNMHEKRLYESVYNKILNAEKSGKYAVPLNDEGVLECIAKEYSELQEQREYALKGNRSQFAMECADMMVILQSYMPQQYSKDNVQVLIEELYDQGFRDKGRLIKQTIAEVGMHYDRKLIPALVTEFLAQM